MTPGDLVRRKSQRDDVVLVIDVFERPDVWSVGIGNRVETMRRFFRGLSCEGVMRVYDQTDYVRLL